MRTALPVTVKTTIYPQTANSAQKTAQAAYTKKQEISQRLSTTTAMKAENTNAIQGNGKLKTTILAAQIVIAIQVIAEATTYQQTANSAQKTAPAVSIRNLQIAQQPNTMTAMKAENINAIQGHGKLTTTIPAAQIVIAIQVIAGATTYPQTANSAQKTAPVASIRNLQTAQQPNTMTEIHTQAGNAAQGHGTFRTLIAMESATMMTCAPEHPVDAKSRTERLM